MNISGIRDASFVSMRNGTWHSSTPASTGCVVAGWLNVWWFGFLYRCQALHALGGDEMVVSSTFLASKCLCHIFAVHLHQFIRWCPPTKKKKQQKRKGTKQAPIAHMRTAAEPHHKGKQPKEWPGDVEGLHPKGQTTGNTIQHNATKRDTIAMVATLSQGRKLARPCVCNDQHLCTKQPSIEETLLWDQPKASEWSGFKYKCCVPPFLGNLMGGVLRCVVWCGVVCRRRYYQKAKAGMSTHGYR